MSKSLIKYFIQQLLCNHIYGVDYEIKNNKKVAIDRCRICGKVKKIYYLGE